MNETSLHLALRELRATYRDPRALATMAIVGVVAGLAGPFGTFSQLPQGLRIVYWVILAFTTYAAGILTGNTIGRLLPGGWPVPLRVILASLAAAVPVTLVVMIANAVFTGKGPSPASLLELYFYCLVVSIGIITLVDVIVPAIGRPQAPQVPAEPAPGPPPLIARVPPHLRGRLVRLATADHYVEIHTDKGMALVLMRFGDAVAETGPVSGIQTHRGHWVALEAARRLIRRDGRPVVEMVTGEIVPVSRGQMSAVRKALAAR